MKRATRSARAAVGVLLALAAATLAVGGLTGTAWADGGCRYAYAYVIDGYSLEPCAEPAATVGYVRGAVNVLATPYSPSVQICSELVPVSPFNQGGDTHCTYFGGTGGSSASFTTDWFNDICPLHSGNAQYVNKAWIKVGSQNYGDVESPIVHCPA